MPRRAAAKPQRKELAMYSIIKNGREIELTPDGFSLLLKALSRLSVLNALNVYSRQTMLKYVAPKALDDAAEIDLILEIKPHFYKFSPFLDKYQRDIEKEQLKQKETRLMKIIDMDLTRIEILDFIVGMPTFEQIPTLPDLKMYEISLQCRGILPACSSLPSNSQPSASNH